MSQDLCRCGSINFLIYFLVIFFGISSWVDINGLWVELPILVQHLPEGWDLPSYMAVIIQIANIAPLVYTVSSTVWPHKMIEVPVIYVIICLGGVACLLLAFLWNVTSNIAGTQHSTALFALQFCLALVDCTSSVAFLPFMSIFKPQYMTAYFIGEGFSGLIPSLVALAQGAGSMKCVKFPNSPPQNEVYFNLTTIQSSINSTSDGDGFLNTTDMTVLADVTTAVQSFSVFPQYQPPKFSIRTFFLFLMVMMIISGVSFTLLNYWSYCKREKVIRSARLSKQWRLEDAAADDTTLRPITIQTDTNDTANIRYETDLHHVSSKFSKETNDGPADSLVCSKNPIYRDGKLKSKNNSVFATSGSDIKFSEAASSSSSGTSISIKRKLNLRTMPRHKYIIFLFLTAWLNAFSNGFLPSIQTYSCLPYGIQPYHLSVTLSSIANPVACFASFFLTMRSLRWTVMMAALGTTLTGYIIWTAVASPEPPLVHHLGGAFSVVICWILVVFIITYTKVSIATEFRHQGKRALLWVGASTQAGSLAGAVISFCLVNVAKVFEVGNPCI